MPHKPYYNSEGVRLPSVTTITKLYGNKDGLIIWANNMGLQGKTLQEAREETATPGSMVHEHVDAYIKGESWAPDSWKDKFTTTEGYHDALGKERFAFSAFQRWSSFSNFKLIEGEINLVSEKYQFGGCLDAVMTSDGLALADWKSGKGGTIYADFLYQLAGYSILWDENFPDNPITAGFHIIRFSREDGSFAHWHLPDLNKEREVFLKLREVYDLNKQVQRRL